MRRAPERVAKLALLAAQARVGTAEAAQRRRELMALAKDALLRQQQAIVARPDGRALLPQIARPTLVLSGRRDQLTPVGLHEEMAAAILGGTLVVRPCRSRLGKLARPESVSTQLLARLEAPAAERGRGGR